MYKIFIIYINIFIFYSVCSGQGTAHLSLMSHVSPGEHSSSIWGWTDKQGNEYAILGTFSGVRIYSLTDPTQPKEIAHIFTSESSWRELKSFGDYIYVVTEANDGLLIINMTQAPDSITYHFKKKYFNIDSTKEIEILRTHTIYIDELGFIYLAGSGPVGGGCNILSSKDTPEDPVFILSMNDDYFHEVHVKGDVMYAAELFNGLISFWDISDRAAPKRISDVPTGSSFTHAVWLEDERPILYSADEVNGAVMETWNVADLSQVVRTSTFRVRNPQDPFSIPHNVFHKGRNLFISWYTEGVRVLDTKYPDNLIEVGYYDTYLEKLTGFHGCWSIYPYFASGLIIASDIEGGLFVFRFDQNLPSYLHINLTNQQDHSSIPKANIQLNASTDTVDSQTNLAGLSKTGFPEEGLVNIHITKPGFYKLDTSLFLIRDSIIDAHFEMTPLERYDLSFIIMDELGMPIENAQLRLWNDENDYLGTSDSTGYIFFKNIYKNTWSYAAGKWSYLHIGKEDYKLLKNDTIPLELPNGYQDDFIFDLGWTQQTSDSLVRWKRSDFSEFLLPFSNYPSKDIPGDIGSDCYYTNNFDLIEDAYKLHGDLYLKSPMMDLSNYNVVQLSYYAWAYGGGNGAIKETYLQYPNEIVPLEQVGVNFNGVFNPQSTFAIDLTSKRKDSIQFVVHLFNHPDSISQGTSLRAALDAFLVKGLILNTQSKIGPTNTLNIYPNPAADYLVISNASDQDKRIEIYSIVGVLLDQFTLLAHEKRNWTFTKETDGLLLILDKTNSLSFKIFAK
ncbi:MAG: choice-of-anchor B family protein [Bacteroidota bacterium]|nr:choice-of-anchor B family protein [Bacteroidota bacterium]